MKIVTKMGAAFVLAAGLLAATADSKPQPGALEPSADQDRIVYVGISPDRPKPMYTTAKDAPDVYDWDSAMKYCAKLQAGGQEDWRVPTRAELNVLFNDQGRIGGFDHRDHAARYWSSTEVFDYDGNAWDQNFTNGLQDWGIKADAWSLRCVR